MFPTKSLDASLKKNLAFIKKMRTGITKESQASIINDIESVTLEKYLSEIVQATFEGLLKLVKNDDIMASVDVISGLHQRFSVQFTVDLMSSFIFGLENPSQPLSERDETAWVSRRKVLFRLFTEYHLVGIFRCNDVGLHSLELTRSLNRRLKGDFVIVALTKEVLSYEMKNGSTLSLTVKWLKRFGPQLEDEDSLFKTEIRADLRTVYLTYAKAVVSRTVQLNDNIGELRAKNREVSMKTGRMVDSIVERIDRLSNLLENFTSSALFLSEFFHLEMPQLQSQEELKTRSIITSVSKKEEETTDPIWESEEERRFYETVPNVAQTVTVEVSGESSGQQMNEWLQRLNDCQTGEEIDECAYAFWDLKLYNKASRNRLFKFLVETEELHKLKNFARFITLNRETLPDFKEEVITYLDRGFRSQIRNDRINFKNIFFFCELIKFRLIPTHVLFHKIRSLILNLSTPNNIEILTIFFENCCALLLNDEEYAPLTKEMLDLLHKKRKVEKLSTNEKAAINTLLLTVNPPAIIQANVEAKRLTVEEKFIRRLVRLELNNNNYTVVSELLLKMKWLDPKVFQAIQTMLCRPDKVNYDTITSLAKIFQKLSRQSVDLRIYVVDHVFESIQRGLEVSDYRVSRSRIAYIRYLAELFNIGVVDASSVLAILYKVLCFGHPNNSPTSDGCELDPPENFFRLQLVCVLLSHLRYSNIPSSLDHQFNVYFCFFDFYLNTKTQPLSLEMESKVDTMFSLARPSRPFTRARSLKQAVDNLQAEIEGRNPLSSQQTVETKQPMPVVASSSDTMEQAQLRQQEETRIHSEVEKEFNRMLVQSMEQGRSTKAPRFNASLPSKTNTPLPSSSSGLRFTFLTKSGKKSTGSHINLPSGTKFASNVLQEEEREKLARDRLRSLVLNGVENASDTDSDRSGV